MSLSKFKRHHGFTANRVFTDRDEPRRIFWNAYEKLLYNEDIFKVVAFYGMGGIGKTRLQNFLSEEVDKRVRDGETKKIKQVFISLDAFEFDSPTDILIAIRKQLKIPTFLFDYALISYWSTVGYTAIDIKRRFIGEDSVIWDVLEEVANLGGVAVPLRLVRTVTQRMVDKYIKSFGRYKDELAEIDQSQPIELFRKLPYYLGLALSNAFEQDGTKHIIYFDAYETMLKKLNVKSVTESADEWIREFIGSSEVGLFVFGSRDALRWEQHNPEWKNYVANVDLEILPPEAAEDFLRGVPIDDPNIRAEIVRSAKGIPLYLNLCVNMYERKVATGQSLHSDDFKMAESEVIQRFLRHLSEAEAELVKTLSALSFFDESLFAFLLGKFHIGYPLTKYSDFVDKSFVLCIDPDAGMYKIHDSIREQLFHGGRALTSQNDATGIHIQVIRSLFEYVDRLRIKNDYQTLARLYSQLVSLLRYMPDFSPQDIGVLLETGLHLSDNGYWNEVERITVEALPYSQSLSHAFHFLQANSMLWKGSLIEAMGVIEQTDISPTALGRFHTMAEFVKTHIIALSGRYDEAERMYESLTKRITYHIDSEKLYCKIFRQWGDLLYLRGKYRRSVQVLDELTATAASVFEQAATIRTKGHALRLNFLSEDAESVYRGALALFESQRTQGYIGKSHTSLMEALCWFKPEEAIQFAPKAIEINELQNSSIELGRIYAALSIAHSLHDKNTALAEEYANLAEDIQKETGYASGVLFAGVAKGICAMAKGNTADVEAALAVIEKQIEELKVYHSLKLPFYCYLNHQDTINDFRDTFEWIDFDRTMARVEQIASTLRP